MSRARSRSNRSASPAAEERPLARLYLIAPPGAVPADTAAFGDMLDAALAAGDVACLLLDCAGLGHREARAAFARLAQGAQARDVAVLAVNDGRLARDAGADGVHLALDSSDDGDDDALAQATRALKPDLIVGAGRLKSRHAAMAAGECDVDYVMFGEPSADGWVAPLDQRVERIGWWADIFNTPCVAYAARLDEVAALAAAGADFVALREAVWGDPRGAGVAVADAVAACRAAHAAALAEQER